MRVFALALLFLLPSVASYAQQKQPDTKSTEGCVRSSYAYEDAVMNAIEPPNWQDSLITFTIGEVVKLDFWTDGEQFILWTDTIEPKNIYDFLDNLDQSCRLPPNPKDAVPLLGVKWDSVHLTASQFAQIHEGFTKSAGQYIGSAQSRYASMIDTQLSVVHIDTSAWPVTYDNSHEHIELLVWNNPEDDAPMLDWIYSVNRLAEESFHKRLPFNADQSPLAPVP